MNRSFLRGRDLVLLPASSRSHSSSAPAGAGVLSRLIRNLAVQDMFVTVYFLILTLAVWFGSGPGKQGCLNVLAIDISAMWLGLLLTRGEVIPAGSFWNAFLYRVSVWIPIFLSYFQLREILPAVTMRAIDAEILAFDMRVFGYEPSVAWDKYVTPATTEWFSFFYFGYFFVLMANIMPMMLAAKNMRRLSHFSLGLMIVFCCGHLGYLLVPGYGPHHFLRGQFHNELEGGFFWALVKASVEAGGAMKDIFPSLHTAVPTYFTLFAFWHRKAFPYRYLWPVLLFCITQIIGATMFLRWHYLVDIFAGLTLAATAVTASAKVTGWEHKRREARGVAPTFRYLEFPRVRPSHDDC